MKSYILFFLLLLSFQIKANDLHSGFVHPSIETRPTTWWHWINGNISKSGITKDLEQMHDKGIGGVTVFNISGDYPKGKVIFGSPEWNELFYFAVSEASRLQMTLGFMNCDGYGTSGGPSIQPDNAMKKITFTQRIVKGGVNFMDTIPKPASIRNYYRDIAVFACPAIETVWNTRRNGVKITCSTSIKNTEKLIDNDYSDYCQINSSDNIEKQYLQFQFDKPYAVSSLVLFSVFRYNPINIDIQSSNDGKNFQSIKTMECKSYLKEIQFTETTARYFRVIFNSVQYYMARYSNELRLIECAFLQKGEVATGLPLINQWEIKSGLWFNYDNSFEASDYTKKIGLFSKKQWINLSSKMDSSGVLKWKIPEGSWKIIRMGYTLTGAENGPASDEGRGLECDKLDKRGIQAQFNGYVAKMVNNNKLFVGKGLNFALIDSYEAGPQNWTQILPEEFRKRRGYQITPWLPVLVGETVNTVEESERFLWDYRRTLADMIGENYYGEMQKLCANAGLKFYAEAANPEGTPTCDPLFFSSKTDVPMCEFWTLPVPEFKLDFRINKGPDGSFKDVISAAHIYNKPIVASESFTCFVGNWQHNPSMLKAQGDLAFCQGINQITFHSYIHQPDETVPGWQMNPWGIAQNRKQTWWEMSSAWFNYLARCQYLLQKGTYVADALVFTSEGTSSTLRNAYGENVFSLLPQGYNYDACNKNVLNKAKVENGKIVLDNGNKYALLILPNSAEMTLGFLQLIKKMVAQGATVYGPKPRLTLGLKNYKTNNLKLKMLAEKIWGKCDGVHFKENAYGKGRVFFGMNFTEVFAKINTSPDFSYSSLFKATNIQFIHKKIGEQDVYFISNQNDHPEELICRFRVFGKSPEIWHPENGTSEKLGIYTFLNDETMLPLRLEANGSVFVVFSEKSENPVVFLSRNGVSLFPIFNENTTFAQTPTYNISQDLSKLWTLSKSGNYEYQLADGTKHSLNVPTILSDFTIDGKWMVGFEKGRNAPEKMEFHSLMALNKHQNPQIKYFSGIATYTKEIQLSQLFLEEEKVLILQLGELHEMASVKVNGQEMGVVWIKPYTLNLSKVLKPGKNTIEIKVANSWSNRIIGDLNLPVNERITWSNTLQSYSGWGNNNKLYTPESPLVTSGLLGPVVLKTSIIKRTN